MSTVRTSTKNSHGTSPFRVSKMVTDRQKAAQDLGAVLDRHAEEANTTLASLVEPYLREGEEAPDLLFLQEVLRRRLADLNHNLVDADEETLGERRQDHGLRQQRDAIVGRLANLLSRLRAATDAAYGPGATAQALGIEGPVPRDPVVLHRLGLRVQEQLREDPFADLEPQVRGILLDLPSWAEDLEEPVSELGTLLGNLTKEERNTVSALIRKQQAMRDYDLAYRSLLQVMEGLLRHTGLEELAGTVRPSPVRANKRSTGPEREPELELVPEEQTLDTAEASEDTAAAWPELRILQGGDHQGSPRARERDPT